MGEIKRNLFVWAISAIILSMLASAGAESALLGSPAAAAAEPADETLRVFVVENPHPASQVRVVEYPVLQTESASEEACGAIPLSNGFLQGGRAVNLNQQGSCFVLEQRARVAASFETLHVRLAEARTRVAVQPYVASLRPAAASAIPDSPGLMGGVYGFWEGARSVQQRLSGRGRSYLSGSTRTRFVYNLHELGIMLC